MKITDAKFDDNDGKVWIKTDHLEIHMPVIRAIESSLEACQLLRELYDLQNGPPLEKYHLAWENVMTEAGELLAKVERGESLKNIY